ncbi:hypothetical protein DFH06DRAFT_1222244 [Mycena polygramma]|nr:hypothetical protein DFH06DRAFT_1222244 [Mycena polygramma]
MLPATLLCCASSALTSAEALARDTHQGYWQLAGRVPLHPGAGMHLGRHVIELTTVLWDSEPGFQPVSIPTKPSPRFCRI